MKRQLNIELMRRPVLITASCLAVTLLLLADSRAFGHSQDPGTLLQEVRAMLRQPLPALPDGVTLPLASSEEQLTQRVRDMLFGDETVGHFASATAQASQPPAAAQVSAGVPQTASSSAAGLQAAAPSSLSGQERIELPPAPPEKYAHAAAQKPPAQLPNLAVVPLPPHPPVEQAPSMQSRPPILLPNSATSLQPRARLPDPTAIPLPPHPPEEQAPWRQGVLNK